MPAQHAGTERTATFSSGRMKRHVFTDFSGSLDHTVIVGRF